MVNLYKKLKGNFSPYNGVKTPVILQFTETECGIASLAMLFSYYRCNVSFEVLREKCGATRDGCKITTLMKVAKEYGFEVVTHKVELDAIKLLREPVIAFWNFNHYVVINGIGNDRVFINDPANGVMAVSMEDFDKAFTGIILAIFPTKNTPKIAKKFIMLPLLKSLSNKFYKELFFVFLCSTLVSCSPLLSSAISHVFIDYCVIRQIYEWLPYLVLLTIFSAIFYSSAMVMQKISQFKLLVKASIMKSSNIILHVLQLPMIFYSLRQKGEIVAILARAEMILNLLLRNINIILVNMGMLIICLFIMFELDTVLASISTVMALLVSLIYVITAKINYFNERLAMHVEGKLYARNMINIKNIETIKSCSLESSYLTKWHHLFCKKINIICKSNIIISLINSINKAYVDFSMLAIIFTGGVRVVNGVLSMGGLIGFYAIHLFLNNCLSVLLGVIREFQVGHAAYSRIQDVLLCQKDSRFSIKSSNKLSNILSDNVVVIDNASFSYNKNTDIILNKINLSIKANSHVAFVGKTGSGKSTLAKMLCGFYQATSGNIKLYDKNITNYSANDFAKKIAYVSQDIKIFSGTLYQNITLWREKIPVEKINQALEMVCLTHFISDRDMHSELDENGRNFSGGEKQRIDIARAIIQDTPLIILDEATSALDAQTENNIIHNLRNLDKTIIYVAHRLSTIKHCEQIVVLDKGNIVEIGNHANLLENKSYYYNLVAFEETAMSYA